VHCCLKISFLLAVALLTSCKKGQSTEAAGLQWNTTVVDVQLPAGEPAASVKIAVKNISSQAKTITHVESNCGCLLSSEKALTLAAGVEGSIELQFKPTPAMGGTVQEKVVKAYVADEKQAVELTVRADIAETLKAAPASIHWSEESRVSQTFTVESPIPFEITGIQSSHQGYSWQGGEKGHKATEHTIAVSPPKETVPGSSLLLVRTTLPVPWASIAMPLSMGQKAPARATPKTGPVSE
jgi:hypothetical protein